jgi:hypothetical protein
VYAEPHVPKDIEFGIYLNGRSSRNEKGIKIKIAKSDSFLSFSEDAIALAVFLHKMTIVMTVQ